MNTDRDRTAAGVAALAAGAALAVALLSESMLGLVPCALCLWERWPYRVAVVLGLLALVVPRRWVWPLLALTGLAVVAGVALASVHVGVEQGWWPSPLPECAAPQLGGGSIADRLARMPARPAKPCDEPAYLLPGVPVSMAAMNLVFSLALVAGLAIWGVSRRKA